MGWLGSAQNEQLLHAGPGGTRPFPDGKKPNRAQQAATARRRPPAAAALPCSEQGAHQPSLRPRSPAAPHVWSGRVRALSTAPGRAVSAPTKVERERLLAPGSRAAADVLSIGENLR